MVSHSVTNFLGFSQTDSVARYFAINKLTKTSFRRKLARAVDILYFRRFFIGKSHVDHRDPTQMCRIVSEMIDVECFEVLPANVTKAIGASVMNVGKIMKR